MLKASRDAETNTRPFTEDLITWDNGRKESLNWKLMELKHPIFILHNLSASIKYTSQSTLSLEPCRDLSSDKIGSWLVQAASKYFVDISNSRKTE